MNRKLVSLLLAFCLVPQICSGEERPQRIKVLATGIDVGMPVLSGWFTAEPSTEPIVIPTRVWSVLSGAQIQRFVRIYFPRSYSALLEYEFFFLEAIDMDYFTVEHQRWIYDALSEHQRGGVNTRSVMSIISDYNRRWRDSIISRAFPNDVDALVSNPLVFGGLPGPLVIRSDEGLPNIMKPYREMIPIRFLGGVSSEINTIPKPGSVVLSYTRNDAGLGYPVPGQIPHVFYWRWNRSITFTFRDCVYYPEFWSNLDNRFSLDIVVNMVWFSVGRDLPADPLRMHDYRQLLVNFDSMKLLLASLLDFAERFGASPVRLFERLGRVQEERRKSEGSYLGGDVDAAHDSLRASMEELSGLYRDAVKLKDDALFWVHAILWLVTTAVLLAAGTVLWVLMFKRSLYQEVRTTRLEG